MNEEDLRDCFAMFALAGAVMAGKSRSAEDVWAIADEMMEARNKPKENDDEEDVGIARVAPKRNYRRKS
jgi:mannose/cellobiose epimerase-like protein (N-acyl-D-glucosamine 2-epimerase family)